MGLASGQGPLGSCHSNLVVALAILELHNKESTMHRPQGWIGCIIMPHEDSGHQLSMQNWLVEE